MKEAHTLRPEAEVSIPHNSLPDVPPTASSHSNSCTSSTDSSASSSGEGDEIEGMAAIDEAEDSQVFTGFALYHNAKTLKKHFAVAGEDRTLCGLEVKGRLRPGAASCMPKCLNCEKNMRLDPLPDEHEEHAEVCTEQPSQVCGNEWGRPVRLIIVL